MSALLLDRAYGRGLAILDLRVFDVQALGFGQLGVLVGIAVDAPEEQEVGEADRAGEGEAPAPSRVDENDADDGNSDGRGEFGSRVKERGGEAALALREPQADGLGVGGKGGRFPDAEQQARAKECVKIGRGSGGE